MSIGVMLPSFESQPVKRYLTSSFVDTGVYHTFEIRGKREWIRGSRVYTIRTTAIDVVHSIGKAFKCFHRNDELQDEEEANDTKLVHSVNEVMRRIEH
jgi:hypothetical protein